MKLLTALMVMMALGLSAYGQEFEQIDDLAHASPDTEDFLEHLLTDDDDDDEVVDLDDAIQKYHMLKEISQIIAKAEARDLMNPKKRFIGGFFNKVKEAIKKAANKVADFFTSTWNKAKEAFGKITDKVKEKVNFSAIVDKLLPFLKSGMSKVGCEKVLQGAASTILGPLAPLLNKVASPICSAALAKLTEALE